MAKSTNRIVKTEDTVIQTHILVPSEEWIRLNNENNSLKEQIKILQGNETRLLEQIHFQNQTIDELRKENEFLKQKILELENKVTQLTDDYNVLREENKVLREENKVVIEDNKVLKKSNLTLMQRIENMEQKEIRREAVFTLHEFDSISNKTLQSEYRKYFNITSKLQKVPNLRDFVLKTDILNDDDLVFWNEFVSKHPNSDNKQFRDIYVKMNKFRMKYDAHPDVSEFTQEDFDKSFQLIFPNIYENKELYTNYKNWIFSFVTNFSN